MDQIISGQKDANTSILNFGHAETIQPILAALGMYTHNENLRVNYLQSRIKDVGIKNILGIRLAESPEV